MSRRLFLPPLLLLSTLGCSNTPPSVSSESADSIELVSKLGSGQATVVLDGRRDDCVIDEVVRGSGQMPVTNLRRPEGCHSEVAVFASDNESKLLGPGWTDGNDAIKVTMTRTLEIPLAIWILYSSEFGDNNNFAFVKSVVTTEVSLASKLFDTEQCGVTFTIDDNDIIDKQTDFPYHLANGDCNDPQTLAEFKNVGFQSGKVNVYYIMSVVGNQGRSCLDGRSNVILIGDRRTDVILAHELGHALSLDHPNDLADYQGVPSDNMMMRTPSTPGSLTLGQCFRANFHTGSLLVRSGFRQSNRDCPHPTTSASTKTNDCPALNLEPSVP
jgi:hypothetical protein